MARASPRPARLTHTEKASRNVDDEDRPGRATEEERREAEATTGEGDRIGHTQKDGRGRAKRLAITEGPGRAKAGSGSARA